MKRFILNFLFASQPTAQTSFNDGLLIPPSETDLVFLDDDDDFEFDETDWRLFKGRDPRDC